MNRRAAFAFGFLALIALGAVVLSSPWAQSAGAWGRFLEALFTATSAVCVTGLTVVDIAAEYSFAGQVAILVLVQLGCLGLMTCGTFLLVAVGRRLSLSREFSLMNAYGVEGVRGLKGLVVWTVGSTLVVEAACAAALHLMGFGGAYKCIFYSIMSFCNAGFSIFPGSLASFTDQPLAIVVMAVETILGGIGFLVIYNLCTFRFLRRHTGAKGRLSLHTRVVLRFSFVLLAITFVVFVAVEWNGALEGITSVRDKLVAAFYQSVTPRTCGFCVIATETLRPFTRLVYEAMMFIGGGPGSAAAGMKVTTFAVLFYTLSALCRGDSDTVISKKTVPADIVRESIVIVTALLMFAFLVTGALLLTEAGSGASVEALAFEAISAVTTTGLSIGSTTASLSQEGRFVIMVAMFIGRLGALTVVMMIGDREAKSLVRHPYEEIVVG